MATRRKLAPPRSPMARLPAPYVPAGYLPRLEAIRGALSATVPGLKLSLAETVRAAIVAGIEAEERRLGVSGRTRAA